MIRELYCYLNGQIMMEGQAAISPFDRGFLWGDGVYEITPCFNRRLFRLEDHLNRLFRSIRYVRIDFKASRNEIERLTFDLLDRNIPHMSEEGVYRRPLGYPWYGYAEHGGSVCGPPDLVCLLSSSGRRRHRQQLYRRSQAFHRSHPEDAPPMFGDDGQGNKQVESNSCGDGCRCHEYPLSYVGYLRACGREFDREFFYGERRGYLDTPLPKYLGRGHPEGCIGIGLAPGDPLGRKAFHFL